MGEFLFWFSCLCDVLQLVPEVAGARWGKVCTYVIWILLWVSKKLGRERVVVLPSRSHKARSRLDRF